MTPYPLAAHSGPLSSQIVLLAIGRKVVKAAKLERHQDDSFVPI
jgi:hypothetical protein